LLQFDVSAWSGELRRNGTDGVAGPVTGANRTMFTSAASEYFK
jgi:hypothetical protein